MKTKILSTIFFISFLLQGSVFADGKESGIELLLKNYNWQNFWEELQITGDIKRCNHTGSNALKKGLIGFKSHNIEGLYIVDVTIEPNSIRSLGIHLGSKSPSKKGKASEDGGVYVNVIKFPFVGNLLKNINTGGIFQFVDGTPTPMYLGRMDPSKWNDILQLVMNPLSDIYHTMAGTLAGGLNCPLYESYNLLSGATKRSETNAVKTLKYSIDSAYFSVGCMGAVPAGTLTTHQDPITNGILSATSIISSMHKVASLVSAGSKDTISLGINHSTKNILINNTDDIYCHPIASSPFPPFSQYSVQLLAPTVSKTNELGVSPSHYALHGKMGESYKEVVFIINQRRDYAAMSYSWNTK